MSGHDFIDPTATTPVNSEALALLVVAVDNAHAYIKDFPAAFASTVADQELASLMCAARSCIIEAQRAIERGGIRCPAGVPRRPAVSS